MRAPPAVAGSPRCELFSGPPLSMFWAKGCVTSGLGVASMGRWELPAASWVLGAIAQGGLGATVLLFWSSTGTRARCGGVTATHPTVIRSVLATRSGGEWIGPGEAFVFCLGWLHPGPSPGLHTGRAFSPTPSRFCFHTLLFDLKIVPLV